MLKVYEILAERKTTDLLLTLPFDLRQRSRLKATLNNGVEVGLILPRGHLLRGGDCLSAEDGSVIKVEAADEEVSTVCSDDAKMLARVSYHLGNRHVSLQVADGWVRYQHDHVLDEMVRGLGAEVIFETAAFEPEGGAYGGHAHQHEDESPKHNHHHSHPH